MIVRPLFTHNPIMTKDRTFFQNTMKDISSITPVLESVFIWAQDLGGSEAGLNLSNAWKKCEKALRDYGKLEEQAAKMGYSSLPNALKALKMTTTRTTNDEVDSTQLPEVFHKVPSLWLSGRPTSKGKTAFPPMSVSQAERKHRVIAPLLIEAWVLSSDDEGIRDKITTEYLSTSADEFEKTLYRYIHDLEEVSLEEEFVNIAPTISELRQALDATGKFDYGVGGSL